jgi:hypothetical protein
MSNPTTFPDVALVGPNRAAVAAAAVVALCGLVVLVASPVSDLSPIFVA